MPYSPQHPASGFRAASRASAPPSGGSGAARLGTRREHGADRSHLRDPLHQQLARLIQRVGVPGNIFDTPRRAASSVAVGLAAGAGSDGGDAAETALRLLAAFRVLQAARAGCAVLAAVILDSASRLKKMPVAFFFSNYEEVGHGASAGIPHCVSEMIAVDMGVVGHNVYGHETVVSICAKDSTGPHDYELRQRLVALAKKKKIAHVVDVFPFYGSDAHATMGAGYDVKVAVIGPGVSASHGVERTHVKGIRATVQLVEAYLADICSRRK